MKSEYKKIRNNTVEIKGFYFFFSKEFCLWFKIIILIINIDNNSNVLIYSNIVFSLFLAF